MIEITVNRDNSELGFTVDGVAYDAESISVLPIGIDESHESIKDVGILLSVRDEGLSEILLSHRFSDFPKEPWTLRFRSRSNAESLIPNEAEISHRTMICQSRTERLYVVFQFHLDGTNWKRLWSISEYIAEFRRTLESENIVSELRSLGVVREISASLGHPVELELALPLTNRDSTIREEVSQQAKRLEPLHELTQRSLLSKVRNQSVVLEFEFPEDAKIACEQYLLYFVQFLRDLGVEASAELRHDAGQVLFAVTPQNKEEALDKIRAALGVYLKLPINDIGGVDTDITIQRLASNIYHLKGQLMLAHAVLQAKDATIQAQQFIIQHERLLSGDVMVDSLVRATAEQKRDAEEVLDGIAEITKYEGKGFTVNLPEIYRRLRALFEKD